MIDVLAVLSLLGYTAKELPAAARRMKSMWKDRSLKEYQEKIEIFAYEAAVCSVLREYYQRTSETHALQRYRVSVDGAIRETSLFTTESWVPLALRVEDVAYILTEAPTPDTPEAVRAYAPSVMERLNQTQVKTWDDPTFRLTRASIAAPIRSLEFSLTSFNLYRFTSGLLDDEIKESLANYDGNVSHIIRDRKKSLPVREALLPNVGSINDLSSRFCVGGPAVVFAMARGVPYNYFLILLQIRSAQVTDSPGRLAVLPQGFHQPLLNHPESEVNLSWTVYKEVFEEIYGGEEVMRSSQRLTHDWYMKDIPPMNYFLEHDGAFRSELVGFGLNARTGG